MIDFEQGIVNRGAWGALQRCMDRASAGEPITVGFLGGSITQGSLSSTPETCYAFLVYRWWAEKFPASTIRYVNAGIGGTTSQFGVARVEEDLLCHEPDFVLTEFSVNDENTAHFQETYEGLVRRILSAGCALMLMHNVCYDSGDSAEPMHRAVAEAYGLPSVSMKPTLYAALCRGELANRDITPDDLHPNDAGHALVAQGIIWLLEKIWAAPREPDIPRTLPAPMTPNRYQKSCRWQSHNSDPVLRGFAADPTPRTHMTECFRRGFTGWHLGDSITFAVTGSCIGVQYRKSVKQPTPVAKIVVDGDEANGRILDGNFDETWGDCLYLETVAEDLERKCHAVEIRIVEAHEHDAVPFYLVSVIGS